jgi:hypothetical protein
MAAVDILATVRDRVTAKFKSGAANAAIAIDPAIWLAIFDAVMEMLQDCLAKRKDKLKLAADIQNPTLIQQLALRRAVIKELGRAEFKKLGAELVTHLVDVAKEATDEEAYAFVDELEDVA